MTGEVQNIEEAVYDHDQKLNALRERCITKRIKLNKDKFRLRASEAKYMSHVLTAKGIRPDPAKVQALLQMERP